MARTANVLGNLFLAEDGLVTDTALALIEQDLVAMSRQFEMLDHARLMGRLSLLKPRLWISLPLGQVCLGLGLFSPLMRRILARTLASLADLSL